MSTGQQRLTTEARLWLNLTLNALPKAQFDMLLFALNPPKGNIPGDAAAQGDRSAKLLEWAESPMGCGLLEVDKVLDQIIAAASGKADKYLAMILSGKISRSTPGQLQAVVELLRKKTGDDSIDIAFFQEGSIKVILNGSSEGLAKLQEMFESGELEQLDIPPVEAVAPVDSNSQDARKARLIQALSLRGQSLAALVRVFDHNLNSFRDKVMHLDVEEEVEVNLFFDVDPVRGYIRRCFSTRDLDPVIFIASFSTRFSASFSASFSARDLVRGIVSTRDLVSDLVSACDLRRADLSGANFRYITLTGVDLTGADLSHADVTGTIFRDNPGLTEADKRDLQRRGAIILDPPSSDVPDLVLR